MKLDETKLFQALINNNYSEIERIIKIYGVDSVDRDDRTILMNCIIKDKIDFVKKILEENSVDINKQDINGYSALHFAVEVGNVDILKLLLKKANIDINIKDNWGDTPLWRAVHNYPDNRNIIKELLDAGSNLQLKNNSGISALEIMKEDQESGDYDYKDILSKY